MKVNFQETIKQKTDKELETIVRDYVFYSEDERLIALKELESRNSMTNDLLMCKKNIESSIGIEPTITEQALEAVKSKKRIYKNHQIYVGALLGGPLVAGYLITENFKAFNEISKVRKTWIGAIMWTIFLLCIVCLLPDDDFKRIRPQEILPLLCAIIAYFCVKYFQRQNIAAYIALGGNPYSWWRTIVVSLIGGVITVAVIFLFALLIFENF